MSKKSLNLEDFTSAPCLFTGFRGPDYNKILALSDEDFKLLYLMRMKEYQDKDGWWKEGKIPKCFECHQVIPGFAELRRYYGRSLHAPCFRKIHNEERPLIQSELEKRYWDRVASLPDVLSHS